MEVKKEIAMAAKKSRKGEHSTPETAKSIFFPIFRRSHYSAQPQADFKTSGIRERGKISMHIACAVQGARKFKSWTHYPRLMDSMPKNAFLP